MVRMGSSIATRSEFGPARLQGLLTCAFIALAAGCGSGDSVSGGGPAAGGGGGTGGGSGGGGGDAAVAGKGGMAGQIGVDASDAKAGSGGSAVGGSAGAPNEAGLDGTAGTGGGTQEAGAQCSNDAECAGNVNGKYCDVATQKCVACKTSDSTTCAVGTFCDATLNTCVSGCDTQDDCDLNTDAGTLTCDPNTHKCVGCVNDDGCPLGMVCKGNSCEAGCTALHGCTTGLNCCSNNCVDTTTDVNQCGTCGTKCSFANALASCQGGKCTLDICNAGFENCDLNAANGCETASGDAGSACLCQPGNKADCYEGPGGTQDVGVCKGGQKVCNGAGTAWGPCVGQVLPTSETCYTPVDDDCNGQVNESGIGCVCTPSATATCYTGPAPTQNVGACKDGTWTCNAAGTAWGACIGQVLPTAETCLTPVDDDCNGLVNEPGGAGCNCTPNATQACYGGPPGTAGVGACKAGTQTCDALGLGFGPCNGDVVPSADVCTDNVDNDCNGVINDGFSNGAAGCVCYPLSASNCYTGPNGTQNVGVCKGGVTSCNQQGSGWGACAGQVIPATDTCNDALDNDCNGVVNDGFGKGGAGCVCAPGAQQDCYTGPANTLNVGVCKSGKSTCATDGKSWGACIGQIIPDLDSCLDSLDNDCNGVVNDGNHLAPGCACVPGTTKCISNNEYLCNAVGDWGAPTTPCKVCVPNSTQDCYTGPANTVNVGICRYGKATCAANGLSWGACNGQVLPAVDNCNDALDNNCNGVINDGDHTAPGCACTPNTQKCVNNKEYKCNALGDWGVPVTPCTQVCFAGQYNCNCNQVQSCQVGATNTWVAKAPSTICAPASGQFCDVKTGTCTTPGLTGTNTPTGTYYQFATFSTSNSVFKGGYDVDSYGDFLYVNRNGTNLDVYKVTLNDTDGDGLMEPNQHPNDPLNTGPMEARTLTFIQTYTTAAPDNAPMGPQSTSEIFVTNDRVYSLGPTRNGDITQWLFATKVRSTAIHPTSTAVVLSQMGYGQSTGKWWGSNENARRVYSFCPARTEWTFEFNYPDLAGSHMDGIESIVAPSTGVEYVYVSDMTSDFLGQYRQTGYGWVQENLFKYNDVTGSSVEGMGFGALNHFWASGGTYVYEIGGGDLSAYLQ